MGGLPRIGSRKSLQVLASHYENQNRLTLNVNGNYEINLSIEQYQKTRLKGKTKKIDIHVCVKKILNPHATIRKRLIQTCLKGSLSNTHSNNNMAVIAE